MKPGVIVATLVACCLLLLVGCDDSGSSEGSSTSTETEETATTSPDTETTPDGGVAQAVFSIEDVGLGPDGYVTLLNFTDQPQDVAGHRLCQEDDCVDLPEGTVKPEGRARVAVGDGDGLSDVVLADAAIGELETSDGELAIYYGTGSADKQLVSYLEWGSTPHARSEEAVDAGLWVKGSFAPTADDAVRLYKQPGGLWVFETA